MTQIYSQAVTFLGDLQGRKSGLGIRQRQNADVAARLKLRVTFFCKLHRQNRLQLCPTRKPNETSQELQRLATLPSHTLLFGHCDFHAYNTEQSERNDQ